MNLGLSLSLGGMRAGPPSLPEGFIAEITRMSGDRDTVVPQDFHDRVARDAFSPALHPVGDPLMPSCAIFTHKATKDGRWSDPTVWDTGTVPGANATVCSGPYNLIYDVLSDVLIKDIHINGAGSLTFDPAVRTRLWVDTLSVDGRLIIGESVNNPIPDSEVIVGGRRVPQCEIVFWQSEAPLATARLGLNTMGPVRIHGARKEGHLQIDGSVLAGATSCTLRQNAGQAGWKVGDEIMFVGTEWSGTSATDAQYSGPTAFWGPRFASNGNRTQNSNFKNNQTEVRTITAVSGTTITWSGALSFDHFVATDTLPRGQTVTLYPVVAMLTQSIRLRTADASDTVWEGDLGDLQQRAHAMFMFNDDIQIRNGEFKNMGRTASDPSLNGPDGVTRYATSDTSQPITNVNNIFGRYPLHIHRSGAFFGRKMVAVERCAVWAPTAEFPIPGWSIVHHDSRAAIDDCNVYNFRGAGIVSETGNEIGQWIGNVVAWGRGDGFEIDWGFRAEMWFNHQGHTGVGYESQARQILQQDNYASGCRHGWLFMQQAVEELTRIPDHLSLRYDDPVTWGGGDGFSADNDTYGVEVAQVPDFFRNHAWDCGSAFWKAHTVHLDRANPIPFIIKESHWVNCQTAYNLRNYTFHYYVYDSLWTGTGSSTAAILGPVMWINPFVNLKLKNFSEGFTDTGLRIAYQTYWLEIAFENVTTPFVGGLEEDYGVDPATLAHWGVMGDEVVTGATTGISRVWGAITDEDLPVPYPLAPWGPDSAERTANPCPALGDAPYVVVDPASDITMTPTGTRQFSIRVLIVDSLGYRWHGDNQSPEANQTLMTPRQTRPGTRASHATGEIIARRNGVFNDGGTWKSRGWFIDLDRATGNHFTWYIDFICTGFDGGFLAANTVDPATTEPVLPLLPETTRTGAIVDPALHTIVSAAAISVNENAELAHELRASSGTVRWSITGGADAAQFEIAYTGGQWVLRWVGNGTQDFEAPADAGANNVYDVQVTATDFLGRAVNQTVAVTVEDLNDTVVDPFFDNFARAAEPLEASLNWERVGGVANAINVRGTGNQIGSTTVVLANQTIYLAPDTGDTRHYVESLHRRIFNNTEIILNYTDANNFIRVRRETDIAWDVRRVLAGTTTLIGNITDTSPTALLPYRLEWEPVGETVTIYRNGVALGTTVTVTGLPDATRVGLFVSSLNNGQLDVWATFGSGSY
jgi:hypothetical protein